MKKQKRYQQLLNVDARWVNPLAISQIEKITNLQLGEIISCGSYGCVMESSDPKMVVKLSKDINEGPAAWAIVSNRFAHPGLVHIYTVFAMQKEPDPVYCLVLERLHPVSQSIKLWNHIKQSDWVESFASWREEAMKLVELSHPNPKTFADWDEAVAYHDKKVFKLMGDVQEDLDDLYTNFSGYPEIEPMLCALCALMNKYGVVISDIHAGNYGIRADDGQVMWSTGLYARPLVLLDVGWASYPPGFEKVPDKPNPLHQRLLYPDLFRSMPQARDFL